MSKNLEIKARCPNPDKIESLIKKITPSFLGTDHQTDTYFHTKNGRFKLRESTLSGSYLIPYIREDQTQAKLSMYARIPVDDAQNVKSLFENLLGIELVVKKRRKIFLYKNVRIHLDEVDNLGTFIEFEAVLEEENSNPEEEYEKIDFLLKYLMINEKDLIASSYQNLMKNPSR
jgi:predicted adenylyl cyclase CyaB